MSIIELALGIGSAIALALSGMIQINIQAQVFQQQSDMAFYVNEAPRIARAVQSLVGRATDLTVYSARSGAPALTGSAIKAGMIDPVTGAKVYCWIDYNAGYNAIEYVNANNASWYMGHNIDSGTTFTLNDDGTITMLLKHVGAGNNNGPAIEMVLERR